MGTNLGVIFLHGHIATPVQAIFNDPMGSHEFSNQVSISLFGREAADAVDHFIAGASFLGHPTLHTKDLLNATPLFGEPVSHLCTGGDHPFFEASVPFIHEGGALPSRSVGLRVFKKELKILAYGRLIVLGDEQIVSFIEFDLSTKPPLGMHGISTDQTTFDQCWSEHLLESTDLIFLVLHFPLDELITRGHAH